MSGKWYMHVRACMCLCAATYLFFSLICDWITEDKIHAKRGAHAICIEAIAHIRTGRCPSTIRWIAWCNTCASPYVDFWPYSFKSRKYLSFVFVHKIFAFAGAQTSFYLVIRTTRSSTLFAYISETHSYCVRVCVCERECFYAVSAYSLLFSALFLFLSFFFSISFLLYIFCVRACVCVWALELLIAPALPLLPILYLCALENNVFGGHVYYMFAVSVCVFFFIRLMLLFVLTHFNILFELKWIGIGTMILHEFAFSTKSKMFCRITIFRLKFRWLQFDSLFPPLSLLLYFSVEFAFDFEPHLAVTLAMQCPKMHRAYFSHTSPLNIHESI